MPERTNKRIIRVEVYAHVEFNERIEIGVLAQATEEEIQRELDEAAQLAVSENCQTHNGLQPTITVTRLEAEGIEEQPENESIYRYEVEVSTHQMLYQTLEIVSDHPLSDEQISEQAVEQAQQGVWERGTIGQSIDIDNVTGKVRK